MAGRRGSGLGLAIARGFTEANGGTLHVESLPGQGATFVFELPLESDEDAERAPMEGADGGAVVMASRRRDGRGGRDGGEAGQPRVLVVDDELQILRALRVVLREAGFEVMAAQSASEALDLAAVARRGRRSWTWCCPTATASR